MITTTSDKVEVLPGSVLWTAAGFSSALGFLVGCALVATATSFPGAGWRHFEADRACRPGMVAELLPSGRAICVGGDGETWVVRYR